MIFPFHVRRFVASCFVFCGAPASTPHPLVFIFSQRVVGWRGGSQRMSQRFVSRDVELTLPAVKNWGTLGGKLGSQN